MSDVWGAAVFAYAQRPPLRMTCRCKALASLANTTFHHFPSTTSRQSIDMSESKTPICGVPCPTLLLLK